MLEDIEQITKTIYNKFISKNKAPKAPKAVYDTYRALDIVISNIGTVSEHYLALTFEEGYLQGSSYGAPEDKWRIMLNKDLERLNKSIKEYLMKLNILGFMNDLYNSKTFYAFVRDNYNVGFIEPCSTSLITDTLVTKYDLKSYHISKFNRIDLSTYKARTELQKSLREKKVILENELKRLKEYIQLKYTMHDLL